MADPTSEDARFEPICKDLEDRVNTAIDEFVGAYPDESDHDLTSAVAGVLATLLVDHMARYKKPEHQLRQAVDAMIDAAFEINADKFREIETEYSGVGHG